MDKHEAAVVGGSLVSFLPGITAQQRQSVLLALLMSERITQGDHAQGLVDDWFSYYRRRLQFLGWDAVSAEQVHWPQPRRRGIVEKALETVKRVAGAQHADSLSLGLQGLLASHQPLQHLEQRSRELGLFQLLPCTPGGNGYVDMVLYHEAGNQALFTAGFLSRALESTVVQAELVRFNVRLFQQEHEATVLRRVQRVMAREILAIDL